MINLISYLYFCKYYKWLIFIFIIIFLINIDISGFNTLIDSITTKSANINSHLFEDINNNLLLQLFYNNNKEYKDNILYFTIKLDNYNNYINKYESSSELYYQLRVNELYVDHVKFVIYTQKNVFSKSELNKIKKLLQNLKIYLDNISSFDLAMKDNKIDFKTVTSKKYWILYFNTLIKNEEKNEYPFVGYETIGRYKGCLYSILKENDLETALWSYNDGIHLRIYHISIKIDNLLSLDW
jgi:hypothetical protein